MLKLFPRNKVINYVWCTAVTTLGKTAPSCLPSDVKDLPLKFNPPMSKS